MSLVAVAEGRPGLDECYKSLKIIGPAASSIGSAADGQWADMEGIGGAFTATMDVVEFALDPIASMAASVAGFLLDYMWPLPDMLDSIAGSPSAVEAKSRTWENVSGRVRDVAGEYEAAVRSALSGWDGVAADAYQTFAGVYGSGLQMLETISAGVGQAMLGASIVVGVVRSIVRDVIADLVGKLISWASQVAGTVGVGATWVVPQAVAAIAIRVERVRDWLARLTRGIKTLLELFNDANNALSEAVPALRRIKDVLEGMNAAPARIVAGAGDLGGAVPVLSEAVYTATSLSNSMARLNDAVDRAGGDS
ncbi:hypothetical protein Cch01nite_32690 [Cellulomonas chitinilytica]|uniref:PPE family domain-containing protein n=1 Tax=Cellulomonas chitinilytica TaxID=398759 RepID=A0A919P5C8_9CELL|nr:hypothetical protein [Cellulomonas chitinilytica]GIG22545.1 hypothetical protein Cch01nite_32690 [Cellulomonas chitinilytica]